MDEKELREHVASLLKKPGEALAALIMEMVEPNHISVDMVSLLLKTRALQPGDSLVKSVRKGAKVHTLVPGSIHMSHEITKKDRVNWSLDGANVEVNYSEWDLANGDIGTVESIRNEMRMKLKDYYFNKIFSALGSIWSAVNTPNNYTNVAGALNSTVLKAAIDNVNQNSNGAKAIVGVRSVLTPITTFGASWSDGTSNMAVDDNIREIMQTGWLGRYYGVPVVALNQEWDSPDERNTLLPTDKILIIGEDVGEFITYGEAKEGEWVDPKPTPSRWNLKLYQQFGMIIDNANGIHVLGNIS